MDKFMIDKYVAEKPFEKPILNSVVNNPVTNNPVLEQKDTSEDSVKVLSLRFISTVSILVLFVGFAMYHAVAYKHNENHYLIKKNARKFETTLDELKTDIKNAMKQKYEQMIDWKEEMRTRSKKMIFNKHLENGAFKTTKYKATNLLSIFDKTQQKK